MSLSFFKNSFFNNDRLQKSNRFFVDMTIFSPIENRFLNLYNEPAIAVEAPNIRLVTEQFEFQNIPLDVPVKRVSASSLLLTFYMRESLNIYKTLAALNKQYGGDPYFGGGALTKPSAFGPNSLYNTSIRNNTCSIKLVDEENRIKNGFIYYAIYPYSILPFSLNSTDPTAPARFSVQFNYAYTKTNNEVDLGGIFQ